MDQAFPQQTAWKVPKDSVALETAKKSTRIKSQTPPSSKFVQTKQQRKQSLQVKTNPTPSLHSRRLEREGISTSKDPTVRREPRRSSTSHLSVISMQRQAAGTKSISKTKELVAGQHQALRFRRSGSSQKTITDKYKKANESCSNRQSVASLGPDMKEKRKVLPEMKTSLIIATKKCQFLDADELSRVEEENIRRMTALILGQKRLMDRNEMQKNSWNSTALDDYNHVGFNLRSNIFQGGPLETRSLMKDSYTPDIFQKATRDPENWYGRKIDELGKWHRKNALYNNLQRAMKEKNGKGKERT
ncbi:ciliary microtubule inner protein 4 [Colius striatus]|nr:ciliary microtubule inner protein 4 [Colius striatus]